MTVTTNVVHENTRGIQSELSVRIVPVACVVWRADTSEVTSNNL